MGEINNSVLPFFSSFPSYFKCHVWITLTTAQMHLNLSAWMERPLWECQVMSGLTSLVFLFKKQCISIFWHNDEIQTSAIHWNTATPITQTDGAYCRSWIGCTEEKTWSSSLLLTLIWGSLIVWVCLFIRKLLKISQTVISVFPLSTVNEWSNQITISFYRGQRDKAYNMT